MPVNPVSRLAHRWSYNFFIGPIPKGKVVMHLCDNRKCCNPRHLSIGTQKENLLDMRTKQRQGTHPKKCTSETLNKIVLMKQQGFTVLKIATVVGFNKRTIFRLLKEAKEAEGLQHHLD